MASKLMPRQPFRPQGADHRRRLGSNRRNPARFTLILVYRGLHCPICRGLSEGTAILAGRVRSARRRVLALSADDEERARTTHAQWGLSGLPLGYGLSIDTARAWGLYISTSRGVTSIGIEEPARFAEPGLKLLSIRPDGTLYAASVNTGIPFARPHFGTFSWRWISSSRTITRRGAKP
ncbi:MAG: AhpC/TSA family protein [Candidatus Competibacteraceae bacterium]